MTDRIPCCVPFCKRTRQAIPELFLVEWICGEHWRMTSPLWRRRFFKAKKAQHRSWLVRQIWTRLKKQAIEAAGGIG